MWPFLQFAGHRYGGPAPAVWVLVRSATAAILTVCEGSLHVGVAGRPAPDVHPQKNLLIFCGRNAGLHDAVAEQLRGQFRGQLFLPVLSLRFLRCPNGQTALCYRPALL